MTTTENNTLRGTLRTTWGAANGVITAVGNHAPETVNETLGTANSALRTAHKRIQSLELDADIDLYEDQILADIRRIELQAELEIKKAEAIARVEQMKSSKTTKAS